MLETNYALKRFNPRIFLQILAVFFLLIGSGPVFPTFAQNEVPNGPVYVVQPGDTLWDISVRFGISIAELEKVNGITNPNLVSAGDRLVIPGLEGFQGIVVTLEVPYGETLRSLSREYRVPQSVLVRLNHLTSPSELYAGSYLVILESDTKAPKGKRATLSSGESLLEMAVSEGTDPWSLVATNAFSQTVDVLPGDVLRVTGKAQEEPGAQDGVGALPGEISSLEVTPLPFIQGKTTEIKISASSGISFTASFMGNQIHFFLTVEGKYVGMQGVHAMSEPGFYPLTLAGSLVDGTPFGFEQLVYVKNGGYIQDRPLQIDPAGLDTKVTQPEDEFWKALATPFTNEKMWSGIFKFPAKAVYFDCYPSTYGRRRSYNGSPYTYYHTGLDICGGMGDPIYTSADGIVVFAGPLTVRGNATMINHGWGVYTAYMHQSEILVKVGDIVKAGQLIGQVGRTGLRITGPHLHWEVWVGGIQVDPIDWLNNEYP
jgi:murein DD-endopeptidase MepM/ murein hydrolase activator NlpD